MVGALISDISRWERTVIEAQFNSLIVGTGARWGLVFTDKLVGHKDK